MGHGVVVDGNRKMTGCLQTFGGHCMYIENLTFFLGLSVSRLP